MDKSKDAKLKRNARIEAESLGRLLTRVIEKHPCDARKVKVNFIGLDGPTDALGYTIPGRDGRADVYINYGTHDTTGLFDYVAKKEGEERKDSAFQFMRMGVAAHEDCHQLMTAFNYEREVLAKYPTKSEQAVRHQFFNILEDPAIEYFSPSYFGGLMQRSLRYVIKNTYDWSPELSESDSAYTQYMNALIQFGDMGCPKGKFTFPEAEDMFMKTASLFNEGVECPDARKRVDIAMEIADIAEPLWRPEVERDEEIKRLLEDIWETFKDLGLRGDGDISEEPADPSSPAVKVAVRRKKAAKAAADKAEKAESEAGEGSGSGESDDGESETDGGSGEGESDDSASVKAPAKVQANLTAARAQAKALPSPTLKILINPTAANQRAAAARRQCQGTRKHLTRKSKIPMTILLTGTLTRISTPMMTAALPMTTPRGCRK